MRSDLFRALFRHRRIQLVREPHPRQIFPAPGEKVFIHSLNLLLMLLIDFFSILLCYSIIILIYSVY